MARLEFILSRFLVFLRILVISSKTSSLIKLGPFRSFVTVISIFSIWIINLCALALVDFIRAVVRASVSQQHILHLEGMP